MQKVSGKSKAIVHKGGWFRMYADILNDPKVQLLPDRLFKFWVNCLAATCERRGYLPEPKELAFRLRLSLTEVEDDLACLMSHGLIDAEKVADKTVLQPHNWFEWQPKADPSKWRMRRLRNRRREGVTEDVTRHSQSGDASRDGKVRTSTSTVVPDNLSIQEKVSTTVEGMYAREVVR